MSQRNNYNNLQFYQTNLKKSFLAAVEMNKTLSEYKEYVVLCTEPYRYNNKFCLKPPGSQIAMFGREKSRASIIYKCNNTIVPIEKLSNGDCVAAIMTIGKEDI